MYAQVEANEKNRRNRRTSRLGATAVFDDGGSGTQRSRVIRGTNDERSARVIHKAGPSSLPGTVLPSRPLSHTRRKHCFPWFDAAIEPRTCECESENRVTSMMGRTHGPHPSDIHVSLGDHPPISTCITQQP